MNGLVNYKSHRIIRIWKEVLFGGNNEIFMPKDSIPLAVGVQHFQPTVWFLVPVDKEGVASKVKERFLIYGCETGKQYFMDDSDIHLGVTLTKDDTHILNFFWLGGKGYPVE